MRLVAPLTLSLLLLTLSCNRQEPAAPPPEVGTVTATAAYESVFGPAPTVAEGTCFAMLGYLPLATDSSQVRPFPLFAFRRQGQLRLVIEKLLGFDRGIAARVGLKVPFPAGTKLRLLKQDRDLVTVDLQLPSDASGDLPGMLRSLAHSAEQFPGGNRLRLFLNGQPAPGLAGTGYRPDPDDVVSPGKPRLLAVRLGVDEEGTGQPELRLLFDRPVAVDHVSVQESRGQIVSGPKFLGVFDMAVVIHPPAAAGLAVGQTLEVDWAVEDRLGRSGSGRQQLAIEAANQP